MKVAAAGVASLRLRAATTTRMTPQEIHERGFCTSVGEFSPAYNSIGVPLLHPNGTDVLAFADGTVETAAENDSFGKYLVLSHAGGYKTLYAHCSALCVAAGDAVKLGQKIALVGQTGSATGPHLHFELSCGGVYYNPEFYI